MAARYSLELEKVECAHYYHCAIYDVPYDLPLPQVAQHVAPQSESPLVKELANLGCRIVPHQLHMYKESLKYKFGYASYFVHFAPNAPVDSDRVHPLVVRWISEELVPQLLLVNCRVKLAQPPECHSSEPFLAAMNKLCKILDPRDDADTRKLETFVLSKTTFSTDDKNASFNLIKKREEPGSRTEQEKLAEEEQREKDVCSGATTPRDMFMTNLWKSVGTFRPLSLAPLELCWLKAQLPDFPPLLITNKDLSTTRCDEDALMKYFTDALSPMIIAEKAYSDC